MRIVFFLLLLLLNIKANQVDFKISYDPNYAPFSYKQDNVEAGLYIDIWKAWAKHNNYKIEFVDGQLWDDAIHLVKENKVDFFIGTSNYEDWMINSDNFYETKSDFFTLSKN